MGVLLAEAGIPGSTNCFIPDFAMLQIAVTGGIACGKSYLGRYLVTRGIPVWEADEAARVLLQAGTPVFDRVVEAFGASILDRTGAIDRRALGRIVFPSLSGLARLNALVHPGVIEAGRAWLETQRVAGAPMAVAVVPLLFEVGWTEGWDHVVCVVCPPDVQQARMQARGWSEEECVARLASQWPQDRKAGLADVVIVSDGPPILLESQLERVLRRISRETAYVR